MLGALVENLTNERTSFRFWALSGLSNLSSKGLLKYIPSEVYRLVEDDHADIRAVAAEILIKMGDEERGLEVLINDFGEYAYAVSSLENHWNKARSLEKNFKEIADNSDNEIERIYARSMLVKLGKMRTDQIYEQETIDCNYDVYLDRVNNYLVSKP